MKNELINHRISRAFETLEDVRLNIKNERWYNAINRLYYVCYYSVIALLLTKDLTARTHKGVRNLFYQHFIETNILPKEHAKFFTYIFEARHESDYDDFPDIDISIIPEWFAQAEKFINSIKEYIESIILIDN